MENATGDARDEYRLNIDIYRTYTQRVNDVYFYLLGTIIPSGLLCNAFCLLVCGLSQGLRRTTTGHYLMALAASDFLFLIGDLIRWINMSAADGVSYRLNVGFMHESQVACKLSYWLRYGAKLCSAWITVAIVIERLIIVAMPLKVSTLSTAGRAKAIIVFIALFSMGLSSFPVWTVGVGALPANGTLRLRCIILQSNATREAYQAWSTAVLRVGTLALPGTIISFVTLIIVVKLVASMRGRAECMEGQCQATKGSKRSTSSYITHQQEEQLPTSSQAHHIPPERQLTIMLVAVCVAFVCLRLPYTISYYIYTYRKKLWTVTNTSPAFEFRLLAAMRITDVIATSNYVVNFFLYGLCGSYFRQQVDNAVRRMFCLRRQRKLLCTSTWRKSGSVNVNDSMRRSCSSNVTTPTSLTSDVKLMTSEVIMLIARSASEAEGESSRKKTATQ